MLPAAAAAGAERREEEGKGQGRGASGNHKNDENEEEEGFNICRSEEASEDGRRHSAARPTEEKRRDG